MLHVYFQIKQRKASKEGEKGGEAHTSETTPHLGKSMFDVCLISSVMIISSD